MPELALPWDVFGNPQPVGQWLSEVSRRARDAAEAGDPASLEALQRQCASIIGFTEYRFPRYQTARHHRLIGEQLERVERGEIDRLMLELPPRHGKSELASKSFPAHCMGLDPTEMFISASATIELARDWGRDVRNIIMSEEYQTVFPGVTLAEDSKARPPANGTRTRAAATTPSASGRPSWAAVRTHQRPRRLHRRGYA